MTTVVSGQESDRDETQRSRRVLVIFPGAIGDLMCLMPALAALARRHPDASLELMARDAIGRLVAGRSAVARAHSIDAREVSALFTHEPSDAARRFFAQFDRIYSFFASEDARFRNNLVQAVRGEVSFHPFRPVGEGHVSDLYLRSIGADVSNQERLLEPSREDMAAAERALSSVGLDASKTIVIFPGSGGASKNWPAEEFVALAKTVGVESTVAILGPAEEGIEPVFRAAGVPVLKDLELHVVAAIASRAVAFVGNDSGMSHLAAAVGAAGAAIFGPTDPARWRPLGERIAIIRREPIEQIDPREVEQALRQIPIRR